jgi:asparagine synthase (glutamine-hydrolysing)
MCGIAGLYRTDRSSTSALELADTVQGMVRTMTHRGPDAEGIWTDPQGRCVLGHRRLSIIDTSDAGRQPMMGAQGRSVITFNGEIYNYLELRPQLEAAGVRLRGRTDTEVLIEAIALWGTEALPRLDGQFAFATFDIQSGELLLARDPFGEKPLYYTELADGNIAFASELQALEQVPGFDFGVSVDAMAEVLSFQYIGAPRSIYRSVRKLRPGHWLRVKPSGRTQTERYFEFRPGLSGFTERPMPDLVDELEDILVRSIRRRMIADVPLGAFLSGGVDSSTVCALIRRKLDRPLMTFSIGFEGAPESEHLAARAFGEHLQTIHRDEILAPDASQFLRDIGGILDEPNADSSCLPTYLLSQFARRYVTVAMSGDGGDEMFGGYGRYFSTLDELAARKSGALEGWKPGAAYFGSRILVSLEANVKELFGFVPEAFADHLGLLRTELDQAEHRLLCEMRRLDVDHYMPGAVLPKVDRMSMRHSLEVRTPFLNTELARFAERLPDSILVQRGRGKILLRELAYRYLPRDLIDLPKQGFGLPMSDWARSTLLDTTGKMLESDDSRLRQAFGSQGVARFMERQRIPGQFSAYQTWAVAMLESWLRHHPAKVPSFDEHRARGTSSPVQVERYALNVVPIGNHIYLAARGDADGPIAPARDPAFNAIPVEVTCRAIELRHSADKQPVSTAASFRLPDWGAPLVPETIARREDLRGATLIFLDEDAARCFDYFEYEKAMALGVASVIFRNRYKAGELIEFEIRYFTTFGRIRALIKLFTKRVAMVSNRRLFRLLGSRRFHRAEGLYQTDVIVRIDPMPDEELSSTFMVFEGTKQLPPIHAAHLEIGSEGKGRYSVYNQILVFSPTDPRHLYRKPYWIVRSNDETQPYFPIALRQIGKVLDDADPQSILARIVRQEPDRPFTLNPGDPVVVCTHGLSPGGAERQWIYLAQALAKAGYRVTFMTYEPLTGQGSHYLPLLRDSGIPLVDASQSSALDQIQNWPTTQDALTFMLSRQMPEHAKLLSLTAALHKASPKVVFAQLDHPNLLAGFASHLAGVPRVVLSFRNYNPTHFPYLENDWYLPSYRLLSTSPRVRFSGNHGDANVDYARWIGMSPERVACVPNAIDEATFPLPPRDEIDAARAELGIAENTPVVLGVFRLSAEKDPLAFLEVCARLVTEIDDLRILLVGVGPMQARLEEGIEQLGLRRHVRLLGRRSDINVLMTLASLFLLTSRKEGMPNVVMEAQLMAKPVVATNSGGTADIVVNGATALLCDIGDVEALTRACLALLRDPVRARQMGQRGRVRILGQFQKEKLAERYLDVARDEAVENSEGAVIEPPRVESRVA